MNRIIGLYPRKYERRKKVGIKYIEVKYKFRKMWVELWCLRCILIYSNRAKRDKAMIPDNEIISIYPYG